jgi:hypothetical protein
MKKTLLIIFSFFNMLLFGQTRDGQTITREEWNKMARKGIVNIIPDSTFKTITKNKSLSGQVLAICEGQESHWGTMTVGVIEIKSTKDSLVYSVLTNNNTKINYKAGEIIKIKVSPLKKTDKYFAPRQLTCLDLKGNILCILNK